MKAVNVKTYRMATEKDIDLMTKYGYEFIKKPLYQLDVEEYEICTLKTVKFTMSVLGEYVRDIFKTDEEFINQKRPEISYFAKCMIFNYKDGSYDYILETDGLNGLDNKIANQIIDQMFEYAK